MPEVRIGLPSVVEGGAVARGSSAMAAPAASSDRARHQCASRSALAWGLVDAVAPPEELDSAVEHFAAAILAGGPRAIRLQKALIREWEDLPTSAAVERGIAAFTEAYATDETRRARLIAGGPGKPALAIGIAACSCEARRPLRLFICTMGKAPCLDC